MRRAYCILSFLLITSWIQANSFCCQKVNGYIGIFGGGEFPSGSYSASDRISERIPAHLSSTDWMAGGAVGVQTYSDDIYIAVQGNLLYNSVSKTILQLRDDAGNINHQVDIENCFQWGADLRLGLEMCGVTPYILGGFQTGSWNMRLINESQVPNRGIPANLRFKSGSPLWGGKVGGGITFPFDVYMINIEYAYTWFGTIERELIDTLTLKSWHHQVSIRQGMLLVGINWLF